MDDKNHLPLFGVGPKLIIPMISVTVISILLSVHNIIPNYQVNEIKPILTILGVMVIIIGVVFWILAVKKSDIDGNIKQNRLVTTGIYGLVRHPIYSAFLFISIGLILMSQNICLIILPIIYWIILTLAMKNTEEKWLRQLYGRQYDEYSKRVSRFVPFLRL